MNRLKYLREEKNMLQEDLAKVLDVSQKTISNYETGERDMSTETLTKLSEYFNVTTDYLLGKSDIRKPEDKIKEEFTYAYHKEMEGLTEEEIADALRFYKKIKYGDNK